MHKTRLDDLPTKRITDARDTMVFPCTNERPTARVSLTRTNENLPHHKWFTLAIDVLLAACLLVFSDCYFRHYFVPARRNKLIAIAQGLPDPLSAGMLGQTVTAVFRPVDLVDCYSPPGDLVLNP